jgi:NAD(P)H-dependent FMN reductase
MEHIMTKPVLQIIIGSTRPGRIGVFVAEWFAGVARADDRFSIEVVDLADVALPLLDEPNHPSQQNYQHAHTKRWSATISRADAVVFVIPEYNSSMNAATKNALDYLYVEWNYKPLGVVSYGGISAGLRAAQAIKQVGAALKMIVMPDTLMIPRVGTLRGEDRIFTATPQMESSAATLLTELTKLTAASLVLRSS